MIPLNELHEGDLAIIEKVAGNGVFRQRLLEMGFQPGQTLFVEKYAPLRDPVEFVIMGYHVSLRREEAQFIFVTKVSRHRRKRCHKGRRRKFWGKLGGGRGRNSKEPCTD